MTTKLSETPRGKELAQPLIYRYTFTVLEILSNNHHILFIERQRFSLAVLNPVNPQIFGDCDVQKRVGLRPLGAFPLLDGDITHV